MFTRPDGLEDRDVVAALGDGWGLRAAPRVEYASVGFGSYHWVAEAGGARWFVTVDDLVAGSAAVRGGTVGERLRRLSSALTVARALRDSGMGFVVAPERTVAGGVVHVLGERYACALHRYVEGVHHTWGPYPTRADRLAVLDLIAAVHAVPAAVHAGAGTDDGAIGARPDLEAGLDDRSGHWDTGPFGEPARRLLDRHAGAVDRALARVDRLAALVDRRAERLVLTHGEPHRANTITTPDGPVLIDWDTTLVAQPERDLWALADEEPRLLADYAARTGVAPLADAVDLSRLRWQLTDVAIAIGRFRRPHRRTEDTTVLWHTLRSYLDRRASRS